MTTDLTVTNSAAITPLVTAGEGLVTTITGKPLTDNAAKSKATAEAATATESADNLNQPAPTQAGE